MVNVGDHILLYTKRFMTVIARCIATKQSKIKEWITSHLKALAMTFAHYALTAAPQSLASLSAMACIMRSISLSARVRVLSSNVKLSA